MIKDFIVSEDKKLNLSKISPDFDKSMDVDKMIKKTAKNIDKILLEQQKLYASSEKAILVVLQAIDAGGKDSTIRKVFGRINPQGCRVSSFKVPTALEKSHDFLWRIHKEVPKKGMIGIFNRSHYESVLVEKVHNWIDDKECKKRYNHIKNFEELLTDSGVTIMKFYLHISKNEQKKRFQDRLDIPEKNWKFSSSDLKERQLFDTYVKQFETVLTNTSTKKAPWFVIPANYKKYRNYIISSIVLETMENMKLSFPPPEKGFDKIVIK